MPPALGTAMFKSVVSNLNHKQEEQSVMRICAQANLVCNATTASISRIGVERSIELYQLICLSGDDGVLCTHNFLHNSYI